jgi:hypothetical protein
VEADKKELISHFIEFFNDVEEEVKPQSKLLKKPEVINKVGMGTKITENQNKFANFRQKGKVSLNS